jgi:murein L,D-transpeptidase YafK
MNHKGHKGTQRKFCPSLFVFLGVFFAAANLFAADKPSETADRIVVIKSERKMLLYRGGNVLRSYRVSLGAEPIGPKARQGDHRTPEGKYVIDARNSSSKFHRALHISYPNARDRELAQRAGVSAGGEIMIHGLPNGLGGLGKAHLLRDWTDGCIAVTDREVEEIWRLVPNGTPIEIKP